MKLRNFEILGIHNTLDSFATKKMPQKISYAITKNLMIIKGDCDCYSKELEKIFKNYDEHLSKNENGDYIRNQIGIPIPDEECKEDYEKDISDLLNIEAEVKLFTIDESVFDYDDNERYDILTPLDIIRLQEILCIKETE